MENRFRPKLTLFHCINSFGAGDVLGADIESVCDVTTVEMACSSMVKDLYLLKAFENGVDGVLVLVCPEDMCRYVEGSIRAAKRVGWVKQLLDEIGLDGRRLRLNHLNSGDPALGSIVRQTVSVLMEMGPNPAA